MFNTSFFFNKTQLKIYFFILLGRTPFNSFELDRSDWNREQWSMLRCSRNKTHEQCSTVHGIKRNKTHAPLFIRFIPYKKQLLAFSWKPVAHHNYKWVPWRKKWFSYLTKHLSVFGIAVAVVVVVLKKLFYKKYF
jgi:hypothetical protein